MPHSVAMSIVLLTHFDYGSSVAVAGLGHLTPRCVTAFGYSSQWHAFAGPPQSGCGLESTIPPVDALA